MKFMHEDKLNVERSEKMKQMFSEIKKKYFKNLINAFQVSSKQT